MGKEPVKRTFSKVDRQLTTDDPVIRFIASTETIDRANDRVEQEWILEPFKKNPVFLDKHDRESDPIGRVTNIEQNEKGLIIDVLFDVDSARGEEVYRKYDEGFLHAVSVQFLPRESETNEEGGQTFISNELLEISSVSIPMNPDAVRIDDQGAQLREFQEKEGHVLSRENQQRLFKAREMIQKVLDEEPRDEVSEGMAEKEKIEIVRSIRERADNMRDALANEADQEKVVSMLMNQVDSITALSRIIGVSDEVGRRRRRDTENVEEKQEDEFPAPPQEVQAALEQGLEWHEEGFSGDGIEQDTLKWARKMADGEPPSEDKAVKMGAWFSRHLAQDDPLRDEDGNPTPKAVAIKLWGGKEAGPAYVRRLYRIMEREIPDGLKELSFKEKEAIKFENLPLAERDREWNSEDALEEWREFADSEEEPSVTYRKNFLWYDKENAENFGAYKLPYGTIVDGEHVAVPRAITTIAGVLQGAQGGVDIPENDIPEVKEHVEQYYQKMREEFEEFDNPAPWNQDEDEERSFNYREETTERVIRIIEN